MSYRTRKAAQLRRRVKAICEARPGYGSPQYRGDPYEAVALQQEAALLSRGTTVTKATL